MLSRFLDISHSNIERFLWVIEFWRNFLYVYCIGIFIGGFLKNVKQIFRYISFKRWKMFMSSSVGFWRNLFLDIDWREMGFHLIF